MTTETTRTTTQRQRDPWPRVLTTRTAATMTAKAAMTVATTTTTTTDDGVVATTHSETTSGDRGARDEGDGERALGGDARTLDGRLRLGRRRRDDTATQRREPRRRRASGPVGSRESGRRQGRGH